MIQSGEPQGVQDVSKQNNAPALRF